MPDTRIPFEEFIVWCIGSEVPNSGLIAQPPCWHFEYEHISGSLYLHKAIVRLPIEDTNEFMDNLTKYCYRIENKLVDENKPENKNKKLSGNIIYQRIDTYQIAVPDSDMKISANEIEIRVLEDLGLEYEQTTINEKEFSFETENLVKRKKEEAECQS